MNETATCANSDKNLANIRSLDVLARHLTRLRPSYVREKQEQISTLIEQCKNYERGNEYLGRRMIETIDRIEGKRR